MLDASVSTFEFIFHFFSAKGGGCWKGQINNFAFSQGSCVYASASLFFCVSVSLPVSFVFVCGKGRGGRLGGREADLLCPPWWTDLYLEALPAPAWLVEVGEVQTRIIFPTFFWLLCWNHICLWSIARYSKMYSTDSIWGNGLANRVIIYDYWWFYFLFIPLIVCCNSGLRALQMGAVRKMETGTTEASTPQWNYFRPIFLCISVFALLRILHL